MSQETLAKEAGVSQQLITKIESGLVSESKKLPKIAKALDISVEDLLARVHGAARVTNKADSLLDQLMTLWPQLDERGKEHVLQAAMFATQKRGLPFQGSAVPNAIHEPKSTYSTTRRNRTLRQ